jgi:hypothetical protein
VILTSYKSRYFTQNRFLSISSLYKHWPPQVPIPEPVINAPDVPHFGRFSFVSRSRDVLWMPPSFGNNCCVGPLRFGFCVSLIWSNFFQELRESKLVLRIQSIAEVYYSVIASLVKLHVKCSGFSWVPPIRVVDLLPTPVILWNNH